MAVAMVANLPPSVKPYDLDPAFERGVALLCCRSPKFWAAVGQYLDPEALCQEPCKMAVQACREVALDLGRGPDNPLLVLQRLRRRMGEGKVSHEQLVAVSDALEQAEDAGALDEESAAAEVAPVLKRRLHREAMVAATEEFGSRGDFGKVRELLDVADKVGEASSADSGGVIGLDTFESIAVLRGLRRTSTGVLDLDHAMGGGLWRSALGLVVGAARAGKSMFLSNQAAQAMLDGLNTALVTLELPRPIVEARIVANLTGVATNDILCGGGERAARAKMADLMAGKGRAPGFKLGRLHVVNMAPRVTTVADISAYFKRCEEEDGAPLQMLLVDYADRVGVPSKGKGEVSTYVAGGVVIEGLQELVRSRNGWGWTGSQMRSQEKGKKAADAESGADSKNKGRYADVVVTLNPGSDSADTGRGEGCREVLYNVAKDRMGADEIHVGPLPTDFAFGRMCMLSR